MSVDERVQPDRDADTPGTAVKQQSKRHRWRHAMAVALPPIVLGLLIVGVWYFISYVMLEERRRFLLRPPHQVVEVGFLDWDNFRDDPRVALDQHQGGVDRLDDRRGARDLRSPS